jgi:hypothetical protein
MPKPSAEDKRKLVAKELKLQEMRTASSMKRDVTIAVSSKGFRSTGLCCDIVQVRAASTFTAGANICFYSTVFNVNPYDLLLSTLC